MTQTLITGMHRSGTTLCLDLIRRHKAIGVAINEGVILDRQSGRLLEADWSTYPLESGVRQPVARPPGLLNQSPPDDPYRDTWVAKMSYPGTVILQDWCDRADRYVRCWLDELGESARIVHMVRHPFSVFASVRRRWGSDPIHLHNYGPISLDGLCRDWVHSTEAVLDVTDCDVRAMVVLYEDLVQAPADTLLQIFQHLELPCDEALLDDLLAQDLVFFGRVAGERASAHRAEPMEAISRSTSWLLTPLFKRFGYADR